MANPSAADMSPADFFTTYPTPALLAVQPDTFKVLTDPEDLKIWEKMLADKVSLKATARSTLASEIHASGGTCCECNNTNDCDQD